MSFSIEALNGLRSVEALTSHRSEVQTRLKELDTEAAGLPFTTEQQTEFATLKEIRDEIDSRVAELNARLAIVEGAANDTRKVERAAAPVRPVATSRIPDNIHDLAEYRAFARSVDELPKLYKEGAKRFLDGIDTDKAHQLDRMLATVIEDKPGTLAQRYLEASGPTYERAFEKYLKGLGLTSQEQAALGTYSNSGADGGYAVPVTLDPSLIPTSDLEITDLRQISRVVSITGKEWQGVTSGGITASRVGEATAITATSPTLAQPRVVPTAVKVVIPFSVEVDGDWAQLGTEMAREIAEAKANEEATTFTTGTGDGATAPQGIERMADTSIIWTQATGNFGVEDVYACETDTGTGASGNPLPERFRRNASFLANKSIYNKIRQFSVGTVGEGSIWQRGIAAGRPNELIGYPAYENSVMDAAVTNGNDILILGNFQYFLIVDRVGMSVELVPHLVDGSGDLTGQRAIFAYWRNGSKILSSNAFRKLRVGEGS
jgi:HK97 family phage major capsid protein